MHRKKTYFLKLVSFLLILGIVFGAGVFLGDLSGGLSFFSSKNFLKEKPIETKTDFSVFWEAWRLINTKYQNADHLNPQDLVYGATDGLVKALHDPYSEFFPPQEKKRFMEDVQGSFDGIGAEIGIKNNILTIIAPLEGTPAQKAGLRSGDKILKINDKVTLNMTLEQAVNLIRGPKDTFVRLTILHQNASQQEEVKIKRATIKVPSLNWSLKDHGKIAYIRIFSFTENLPYEFDKVAQDILSSSAQKIILDLRGNPGGYLESAVQVAGWFLNRGDKVVIEESRGLPEKTHLAQGKAAFHKWPMVVLIDEGSASASEILAGALRDDLGVKLIGQKSFGKGSVQEMMPLRGGAALKLTIANWLTPKGISINKAGLKPDIQIKLTQADLEHHRDPQLSGAIEYLKKH